MKFIAQLIVRFELAVRPGPNGRALGIEEGDEAQGDQHEQRVRVQLEQAIEEPLGMGNRLAMVDEPGEEARNAFLDVAVVPARPVVLVVAALQEGREERQPAVP